MQIRRHWLALLGTLGTLISVALAITKRILDLTGYIDIIKAHAPSSEQTWLGVMIELIKNPPDWFLSGTLVGGIALIYWDIRRTRKVAATPVSDGAAAPIGTMGEPRVYSAPAGPISILTHDELRQRVSQLAANLRALHGGFVIGNFKSSEQLSPDATPQERSEFLKRHTSRSMERHIRQANNYEQRYKTDVMALVEELESRLGIFPPYTDPARAVALNDTGAIAPPLTLTADYLESLARRLP